jgi:hypothetical protein
MNKINLTVLLPITLALAACISTPLPNPVIAKQSGDALLTCEYIKAEYAANTESATRKIDKNNNGDAKDLALGLLVWPGLADFNNAPGHEGNALLDRNAWLINLAKVKGKDCSVNDWPKQPKRY